MKFIIITLIILINNVIQGEIIEINTRFSRDQYGLSSFLLSKKDINLAFFQESYITYNVFGIVDNNNNKNKNVNMDESIEIDCYIMSKSDYNDMLNSTEYYDFCVNSLDSSDINYVHSTIQFNLTRLNNFNDRLYKQFEDNTTFYIEQSGVYSILFVNCFEYDVELEGMITFYNPYGYLPAIHFPSLINFILFTVIYFCLFIYFNCLYFRNYNDLINYHRYVMVLIIWGLTFSLVRFSDLMYQNMNGDKNDSIVWCVIITTALFYSFWRIIVVIFANGFGLVKPFVGLQMYSLFIITIIFFFCEITIVYLGNFGRNTSSAHLIIVFVRYLLDIIYVIWTLVGAKKTTRSLQRRNENEKSKLFQKFFIFILLWSLSIVLFAGYLFYIMIQNINLDSDAYLTRWKIDWMRNDIWDMFQMILIGFIAYMWRPRKQLAEYQYLTEMVDLSDFNDLSVPNAIGEEI